MVHKFVSKGTIEEKIDAIINSKKELAENVIGSGGENGLQILIMKSCSPCFGLKNKKNKILYKHMKRKKRENK